MADNRFTIRCATTDDTVTVAEHRARMFEATGRIDSERGAAMIALLEPILRPMLASGEYLGWLVVAEDESVIAGAGVQVRTLLPRPETDVPREALVVNVYVEPAYRRQGLARRLMEAILAWSREHGVERVSLHASMMGQPLYESLGFVHSNEFVLYLK
jgi:GNAT superfamily N-acetyltransferase